MLIILNFIHQLYQHSGDFPPRLTTILQLFICLFWFFSLTWAWTNYFTMNTKSSKIWSSSLSGALYSQDRFRYMLINILIRKRWRRHSGRCHHWVFIITSSISSLIFDFFIY
jgi:hypothetical protein